MFIFDAHLDLAMNAMEWNRDLTRPINELRQREKELTDKPDRGQGTVCFAEMRKGKVGLCVATLIARYVKPINPLKGWHSPAQAWAQTQGQLAWYRAMEEEGELVQITSVEALEMHQHRWEQWPGSSVTGSSEVSVSSARQPDEPPIGYVLTLEGADSLDPLNRIEQAYEQGLRAIGPAHYGPGTYAHGTQSSGGIGPRGRELLKEMERMGIILDVTHLCFESFWEAVDVFHGAMWASHSNCRALSPNERQLSDEQIKCLIERGAVIGAAVDAWMLVPGWVRHKSTPQATGLKLERLLEHVDHVCQIAGNARHAGIGSDLDGGFGREQTPCDLETIADLAALTDLLAARGYSDNDVSLIMHGNFVRLLKTAWTSAERK
jgi:membrane dipeptidase